MMRHLLPALAAGAVLASPALRAQATERPAKWQVSSAVLPLPDSMRAGAAVLGYQNGKLVSLRRGTNDMICLADNPAQKGFEASCYHRSLEPFMARGRALRASGVKGDQVDTVRFAEVRAKKLAMPTHPASLYQLFGPPGAFDPATGSATKARSLFIVYLPGATAESTGLSTKPAEGTPWLMFPGTPKAHIMLEPKM